MPRKRLISGLFHQMDDLDYGILFNTAQRILGLDLGVDSRDAMASINLTLRLPEELLLHITELSDDNQDIVNLRLTCRTFKRLGADALSKRLTRLCVTSDTKSMKNLSHVCNHGILGKRITEVIYVRRPGTCEDLDIIDHMSVPEPVLRNAQPLISRGIPLFEWWSHILTLRRTNFQRFKEGVKSLPQLSRLTYAREWPDDGAWNIMKHELRGPYPEPLDDDGMSLQDDWCGIRFVLETLKEIRTSGKTISLDLRTPMASGMLGPNTPSLNTLRCKVQLVVSTMPFLTRLDLFIPFFISDWDIRRRGMATVFNLAVNLEHFQLLWPYGQYMPETLAAHVLGLCTWPKLRDFRLLRSGGLDRIEIESEYLSFVVSTLPYHRLKAFFTRHQTIRGLQLRNILVGEFGDYPILWDENMNDSPAVNPFRSILAPLPLLRCSVVLDTFKDIAEDLDMLIELDEDIEYLGQIFGKRDKRLENHHPNIRRSYEFGTWLMQALDIDDRPGKTSSASTLSADTQSAYLFAQRVLILEHRSAWLLFHLI